MNRKRFLATSAWLLALAGWRPRRAAALAMAVEPAATLSVDPRIELFTVILYLSDFRGFGEAPVLTELSFPYLDDVESRFGSFRDHPVVKQYDGMARAGFWLGHPPSAMLHLSDPPGLSEHIPIHDFTVRMAGGRRPLDTFLAEARRFALDSRFMEWFDGQASVHDRLVSNYRDRMEWNYVQDLVHYYGERRERYELILAPLSHGGGFGPRVLRPDGRYDAYAVIGPRDVRDGLPDFGSGQALRSLLWHEFSHAHVNHLTDRHLGQLMTAGTVLQGHLREQVEAYVPWEVHVSDWISEHVVRGVTTRLTSLKLGAEESAVALRRELRQFPHVGEVCERLKVYERDRLRYPTLESFYPELVRVFEAIAAPFAPAS